MKRVKSASISIAKKMAILIKQNLAKLADICSANVLIVLAFLAYVVLPVLFALGFYDASVLYVAGPA